MTQTPHRHAAALLAILALSATLTACGGGDESSRTPASGGPASGVTAGSASDGDADAREVADYELTMDDVRKWAAANTALARAVKDNPELEERVSLDAEDASIDAIADRLEEAPAVRAAIEGAGLSTRDYAVTTFALMQAMFAQAALQMGAHRDSVLSKRGVNPDNIEFVKQHEAELRKLMATAPGQ